MEDLLLNLRNIRDASPDLDITFDMLREHAPDVIAWLEVQGQFELLAEIQNNGLKNI